MRAPDMNNSLLPRLFTRGGLSCPVAVKGTLDGPWYMAPEVALAMRIPLLHVSGRESACQEGEWTCEDPMRLRSYDVDGAVRILF